MSVTTQSISPAPVTAVSASQILAMAAKAKYEAPRVDTHRLNGLDVSQPLSMSGNV